MFFGLFPLKQLMSAAFAAHPPVAAHGGEAAWPPLVERRRFNDPTSPYTGARDRRASAQP